jgi:TonB family protein
MTKTAKLATGAFVLYAALAGAVWARSRPAATPAQGVFYDNWLNEDVAYIISPKERDVFLKLKTDKERDLFIESFWKHRDPNPATPENEFKTEHYRRLSYANEHYAEGDIPGWKTESGRFYILFGKALKPSGWRMKMSVIEGVRAGAAEPPKAVASSSLRYGLTATLQTELGLAETLKQIERTFNFVSARMLTEADFLWRTTELERDFHLFRLDGKEYAVFVTPVDLSEKLTFRLEVFEQGDKGKINLLDTEFAVPDKTTIVFGFEDSNGTPYFLAFQMLGWLGETIIDGKIVELPMAGQPPAGAGGESVRIVGELKPPRLLRQVDPVYPPIARQARVEGVVILEATIDIYGRVQAIKILRSIPLLDQAAIDAVRQWVYEPMMIKGKPRSATFTITVSFNLNEEKSGAAGGAASETRVGVTEGVSGGVSGTSGGGKPYLKIEADGVAPRLLKQVDPIYPEIAKKAKVEGIVILEATVDIYGRVQNIKVLRSIPLLDQAAIDAVRQWQYEPVVVNGKPRSVAFTVTVYFQPDWKEKGAAAAGGVQGGVQRGVAGGGMGGVKGDLEPVRATGDIQPPMVLTRVEPEYPEEARANGVSGVVILEVETDLRGRVAQTKVLRSIPALDQAAIDAVRQWIYEPMVVDGKPRRCIFTVTVHFNLK